MKKDQQHPAREERPKMWRSLGELENDPAFEENLRQEFPRGADVYEDSGMNRRDFMKLLGASMSLAGLGLTGCRRPEIGIVPFSTAVEYTIPGKNLYYATSMPTRLGSLPVLATTVDGRPLKIEGNPGHPASNGSTNAFAQASVLDVYDPHRSKEIKKTGGVVNQATLQEFLAAVRAQYQGKGTGLSFLVEKNNSPTRERLRGLLEKEFPGMVWAEYEPLGMELVEQAVTAAFGAGITVQPAFAVADVILSLDQDFLNANETGISFAKDFYPRRNPEQKDHPMNRLYVVESAYSLTGGMADHRLALPANHLALLTVALGQAVATLTGDASLAALVNQTPADAAIASHADWIRECAADLVAHQGHSLVLCGFQQPLAVQLLTIAINQSLQSYGKTLLLKQAPASPSTLDIAELSKKIEAGGMQTLFVLGGNPVYNAPANLDFAKLLSKVETTVHWSLFEDETSAKSTWHLPAAHYLESWGDGRAWDGTLTPVQPMILPLWGGLPELEIYASLLGLPLPIDNLALVQTTFNGLLPRKAGDPALAWNEFLRRGYLANTAYPPATVSYNAANVATAYTQCAMTTAAKGLELVFLQSSSVDDGRYANNSWLLETPDFATQLTWDNALLASLADMKKLDAQDGDMMEVSANGRKIEAAILAAPGQAEGSFAIALGYGHHNISALIDHVGFDAYPLRSLENRRFVSGIQVRPLARTYVLALAQEHNNMEGRDLAREGTLSQLQADPAFPQKMSDFNHLPEMVKEAHQLFTNNFLTAKEQWAMAIDLNLCTGCNACLVACRAENNVPVVGKDQVKKGRDMAWIRIDRWFAGEPENPEMLSQPITCQQCENAPCETVCPVNATVHSEDGLNLMTYNRCIGTRYCANNCPWKVRRFNFFDYNSRPLDELYWGPLAKKGMAESLKMVKNPNVTVRMRGVMEKCNFCNQRIEEAKISRLVQAGATNKNEVPVGPFQVACQQACPSDAIIFGDQNDASSLVAQQRKSQRGYTMFGYVNTRPRITYLARIKNPNPRMPGAEIVGKINVPVHGENHGTEPHKNAHGSEKATTS